MDQPDPQTTPVQRGETTVRVPGRFEVRLCGLLACLGVGLGVAADFASLYSFDHPSSLRPALPLMSLHYLLPHLLDKPRWLLELGHYLALVGIPLGGLGLWPIYRAVRPVGSPAANTFGALGAAGCAIGTAFHASIAFVVEGLQFAHGVEGRPGGDLNVLVGGFEAFFQPLGFGALFVMGLCFGWLGYLTWIGRTVYPPEFVVANPIVVQVVLNVLALLVPSAVGVPLFIVTLNLSLLILFASSTLLLWNGPTRPR